MFLQERNDTSKVLRARRGKKEKKSRENWDRWCKYKSLPSAFLRQSRKTTWNFSCLVHRIFQYVRNAQKLKGKAFGKLINEFICNQHQHDGAFYTACMKKKVFSSGISNNFWGPKMMKSKGNLSLLS